jgi:hypothetical protein
VRGQPRDPLLLRGELVERVHGPSSATAPESIPMYSSICLKSLQTVARPGLR